MKWILIVFVVIAGGVGALLFFETQSIAPPEPVYAEVAVVEPVFDVYIENAEVSAIEEPAASHIKTPSSVKAVYMSSYVAGTPHIRKRIVTLMKETEINAVVIDIKDASGRIAFPLPGTRFDDMGVTISRIRDIESFIEELHQAGMYVIGRVQVFQDPYLATLWPDHAVRSFSTGEIWRDRKGIAWLDPGSQEVWEYIIELAHVSHALGFDEINLDYIRYPSDGNISDTRYPRTNDRSRREVMREFFAFVDRELSETDIVISADIFGAVTTVTTNDLGIGQYLEDIAPYVDYLAPMIYPSHYAPGSFGFPRPAEQPYGVISRALQAGIDRLVAMGEDPGKLRPWLQDFNMGATYTADMVRAQIQATYDVGLTSWMLWDPANTYTQDALMVASDCDTLDDICL